MVGGPAAIWAKVDTSAAWSAISNGLALNCAKTLHVAA
jgi:hypothetical protein